MLTKIDKQKRVARRLSQHREPDIGRLHVKRECVQDAWLHSPR
jgi:hypothetical protein